MKIFVSVRAARIPVQISNHVRSAHFEAPADVPSLKSSAHPWLLPPPMLVLYLPSKLHSLQSQLKTGAQHQSCSILYQKVQSFVMNTHIWASFRIQLSFFYFPISKKDVKWQFTHSDSLWLADCQKCACKAHHHFLDWQQSNFWLEEF